MVRVPTYANYNRLLMQTMNIKNKTDLLSYQATTGVKYANYGGYGMHQRTKFPYGDHRSHSG